MKAKIEHNDYGKSISLKALLVVVNKGKILVSKGKDGSFVRPPGGHIEYFEDSKAAIRREIEEEIGSGIKNPKLEKIVENRFYFDGAKAHDINFIYSGALTNKNIYKKKVIMGDESGMVKKFYWISLADITKRKENLVPKGVLEVAMRLNK
jgi:ADP-ribose pyrophosphatase YjhB (NUDIX family)